MSHCNGGRSCSKALDFYFIFGQSHFRSWIWLHIIYVYNCVYIYTHNLNIWPFQLSWFAWFVADCFRATLETMHVGPNMRIYIYTHTHIYICVHPKMKDNLIIFLDISRQFHFADFFFWLYPIGPKVRSLLRVLTALCIFRDGQCDGGALQRSHSQGQLRGLRKFPGDVVQPVQGRWMSTKGWKWVLWLTLW